MLTLRKAREQDLKDLFEMAKEWNEDDFHKTGFTFDDEVVQRGLCKLLFSESHLLIVGVDDTDRIAGCCVGYLTKAIWSGETHAVCIALYVRPERRGTTLAARMLNAFEQWADSHGCTHVCSGVFFGENKGRINSFFEKMGYKPLEALMQKEIV